MQIIRVGLDLAKRVFGLHAIAAEDRVVLRKTLRRDAVAQVVSELAACVVGMAVARITGPKFSPSRT